MRWKQTFKSSGGSLINYGGKAAALMMVVASVTGCSKDSAMLDLSAFPTTPQAASLAQSNGAELPDPPPALRNCIKRKLPQTKEKKQTADDRVLNAMAWGSEKQVCGEKLMEWYQDVRKANGSS